MMMTMRAASSICRSKPSWLPPWLPLTLTTPSDPQGIPKLCDTPDTWPKARRPPTPAHAHWRLKQALYKYKFFNLSFISICIYINISGKLNPRNNTNGTDWGDSRPSGWWLFLVGGVASLQLRLFLLAVGWENLPGCVQVELPELLWQFDRLGHHSLQLIIIAHLQREFYRVRNCSSMSWWSIRGTNQHRPTAQWQ